MEYCKFFVASIEVYLKKFGFGLLSLNSLHTLLFIIFSFPKTTLLSTSTTIISQVHP